MHIVYASDNNYADILGVSIVSLYDNNREGEITIYILDSGISELNKVKIESVCRQFNRSVPIWIKAKDIEEELGIEVYMDRGSLSQYARLFVSTLLPKEIDRVLYLDCDVIINKPIYDLWNIDMEGKTIAALGDAFSRYYRSNIGLMPEDVMFNSGVMLIDMKKWKKNSVEKRLLEFIKKNNGIVQQGDQGVLNAILSHETYCIHPKYNSVTIFYDFSYRDMMIYRKPPSFYSEEQINEAVNEPAIIHFTTSFLSRRPWVKGCEHKHKNIWLKYKNISPWKDEELREYSTSRINKLYLKLYKILPKSQAICFSGLLQAYVRPAFMAIKKRK